LAEFQMDLTDLMSCSGADRVVPDRRSAIASG